MDDLKCPWCGEVARIGNAAEEWWFTCGSVVCMAHGPDRPTEAEARADCEVVIGKAATPPISNEALLQAAAAMMTSCGLSVATESEANEDAELRKIVDRVRQIVVEDARALAARIEGGE